jgi:hypothetical protein
MKGRKPKRPQGRGELRADSIYTIGGFMTTSRLGRHSLASLRKLGLPTRTIGQRVFIDGQEALNFLRRHWQDADQGGPVSIQEVAGGQQQ